MVIKNLNPVSYNGNYAYEGENYKVEGSLTTDGQKVLTSISGSVKAGEVFKANYNAYQMGEGQMRYNFTEIQSISELAAIATEVEAAVAAVNAELAPQQ